MSRIVPDFGGVCGECGRGEELPRSGSLSDLFDLGHLSLGGTVRIGPTAEDGLGPARCLKLNARDPDSPILLTVSFDVKLITALPALPTHVPRVRLTWGSDKGGGDATVDLRHGLRVSLETTSLQADAIYDFQPAAVGVNAGPDIVVVSSIGLGSVGNQDLTFTEDSQVVAALAAGAAITVPSYARSLEVQSSADPTIAAPNNFLVELFRGTVAGGLVLARYDGRDLPITLPNGGEIVRLTNQGPGAATYTPIFHLTL